MDAEQRFSFTPAIPLQKLKSHRQDPKSASADWVRRAFGLPPSALGQDSVAGSP